MIKGYRFISGGEVSRLFRTVRKAQQAARCDANMRPTVIARDTSGTGRGGLCDLYQWSETAGKWVYLREGLNRGAVETGIITYRDSQGTRYDYFRFSVPYAIWGDPDFGTHFSARPTRRMLRKSLKELKRWYLEFHGEPIAEGE